MSGDNSSFDEKALTADLKSWWDAEVSDEDDPFAPSKLPAGTIFDALPAIERIARIGDPMSQCRATFRFRRAYVEFKPRRQRFDRGDSAWLAALFGLLHVSARKQMNRPRLSSVGSRAVERSIAGVDRTCVNK